MSIDAVTRTPESTNSSSRADGVRRVLLVVLALNLIVLVTRNVVAIRTGALTVIGSALESGLDVLGSLMGVLVIGVATRGPDEDHPYGHAKFESLGALGIAGFLSISCFELLRQGATALAEGRQPRPASGLDVAALGFTLVLNGVVVWHERRRGRELSSSYLIADAAHTLGDVLVTGMALLSLYLTSAGAGRVDGALGIAVALVIGWSGVKILRQSVPVLVDASAVEPARLSAVLRAIPLVSEVRTARSRSTANGLFVDVTIAVDGSLTVEHAHDLADIVEHAIEVAFGPAEVTVHVEPFGAPLREQGGHLP